MREAELSDEELLLERLCRLEVAAAADVMATMGFTRQVLDPAIRPLGCAKFGGRAVCASGRKKGAQPAVPTFRLDDAVTPGSVVMISTDGCRAGAIIGENMVASMVSRGARGVFLDGGVRDSDALEQVDIPVWCAFSSPASAHADWGYVAIGEPISLPGLSGSVQVSPGDLVVADADGACVIPLKYAGQIIADAETLMAADAAIAAALSAGESRERATKSNPRLAHVSPIHGAGDAPTE